MGVEAPHEEVRCDAEQLFQLPTKTERGELKPVLAVVNVHSVRTGVHLVPM